jgi:hypothetical protein
MDPKNGRYLNIIVGIWLFISAFVWRHSTAQFTNTWIMGIVVVAIAAVAFGWTAFRYVNTLAGAWLIISAFALPTFSAATRWNNFIVGVVVVLLSLAGVPVASVRTRHPRPA